MKTTLRQNINLSLQKLIKGIDGCTLHGGAESLAEAVNITGITQDSRKVEPGYLFAAIKGTVADGAEFIPAAIEKGAAAILCEEDAIIADLSSKATFISHSNTKLALAKIAANFYHTQPEVVAAITGTNGKTSTAYFCAQLWQLLGKRSASIGTIGIAKGDGLEYGATGSMTTPDPVQLHKILSELEAEGITHLAMEASSHGLDQYRMDGVHIKAAAFTNITRDHLDYHGSFEKYLSAKLRLFEIMKDGVAVINADIPESKQIISACETRGHKILSIGKAGNYIIFDDFTSTSDGQQIAFEVAKKLYTFNTHLIGEFQAYNLLTALALVVACGANIDEAVSLLPKVEAVPGRMQGIRLDENSFAVVYVDYAHTPDALEKALKVLQPYTKGKLWVVFGCGGDRDKGKRPQMGAIAEQYASKVIITDDNPRTEDASQIRREIIAACPHAVEIADREKAIEYAIKNMETGDMVLIAGKGHEKSQIIGNKKLDFDDAEIARVYLANYSVSNFY